MLSTITKHVKTLNSYSYILKFDIGNSIFYSVDTYETTIDIVDFLQDGNLVYHYTCMDDSKDNVHTSLRKLCELVPKEYSIVFILMKKIKLKRELVPAGTYRVAMFRLKAKLIHCSNCGFIKELFYENWNDYELWYKTIIY